MTITELRKRKNKYWIYSSAFTLLGALVLLLAINPTCSEFASSYVSKQTFIFAVLIFGLIIIFGGIFISANKYLPKCPSCEKAFYPLQLDIVIATKNCTFCGKNVVT